MPAPLGISGISGNIYRDQAQQAIERGPGSESQVATCWPIIGGVTRAPVVRTSTDWRGLVSVTQAPTRVRGQGAFHLGRGVHLGSRWV